MNDKTRTVQPHLNDEEYLEWLYREFLSRRSDPIGKQLYLDALNRGEPRVNTLIDIVSCDERKQIPKEFVSSGHFFSVVPSVENVRYATSSPKPLSEINGIVINETKQIELLEKLASFYQKIPFNSLQKSGYLYRHSNGSYPLGDASMLISLIGYLEPKNLIEIGCGNSSCAVRDANRVFLEGNLRMISIEPFPELFHRLIPKDKIGNTQIIPLSLQDIDTSIFSTLKENDILFIDTTHVSKAGSDVNQIIFEILPKLNTGVVIHIHDIFYPFEYPREWLEEGRCWNEQYIMQAFLQYNTAFEIILWPQYMLTKNMKAMTQILGSDPIGGCSSIWLRKK